MKNCRDCKYCKVMDVRLPAVDRCTHPKAVFTNCMFEREDLGSVCKQAGYLFEEK